MRILIVDDNHQALESLGRLFTLDGHTVTLTTNATEGLAHAAANIPDVILLDIALPTMDGFSLAKAIRAIEMKPRPLIIAVSAYSGNDDVARGRAAGFDYHFPKSVSPAMLKQLIQDRRIQGTADQLAQQQDETRIRSVK